MQPEKGTVEDLELRISRMEKQAVLDQDLIARLVAEGRVDKRRLEDLQTQASIDAELIATLSAEGVIDRLKIEGLEIAMITARRIGAAMGILMASTSCTDDGALELLRQASQHNHRTIREVAEFVILTGQPPGPAEML